MRDEQRVLIAASVLLLETAYADFECSDDEMSHVMETLREKFGISREYTEDLLEIARRERAQAIDLWQYANLINQQYSLEEKKELMAAAWRIIYIDGELEKHEDHFAHKLATLLRLSHSEMIEAKIKGRDQVGAGRH